MSAPPHLLNVQKRQCRGNKRARQGYEFYMYNRPYQHLLAKCQDVCEKNEMWKMHSEDHDAADAHNVRSEAVWARVVIEVPLPPGSPHSATTEASPPLPRCHGPPSQEEIPGLFRIWRDGTPHLYIKFSSGRWRHLWQGTWQLLPPRHWAWHVGRRSDSDVDTN